jgi:hypothetical protein
MKNKNLNQDIERLIEFIEIEIALGDLNNELETDLQSAINKIRTKFNLK